VKFFLVHSFTFYTISLGSQLERPSLDADHNRSEVQADETQPESKR